MTGAGTTPGGELLGIGEAIVVLFAAQGAGVAIADVSAERAAATLELVREIGGDAVVTVGDLTDVDANRRCVDEAAAALGGLTRDWAYVHGREGIRVNSLLVGHLHTPMGSTGSGARYREVRRRSGLLGTEGVAWDVAWPAVFLASDESRWITGIELPVDAGTSSSGAYALHLLNEDHPADTRVGDGEGPYRAAVAAPEDPPLR